MATIKLKSSSVSNKVPLVGELVLGEICINTFDGKQYFKRNNGTDSIIRVLDSQDIDIDSSFTANSDVILPSQKAVKTAIDNKQNTLVNTANIKSINGNSILGAGNLVVSLSQKAGVVLPGSFSGNPKKTTVTFASAFADANYSVSIIGIDSRSWSIESVSAGSFIINARANGALTGKVYWTATKHGET